MKEGMNIFLSVKDRTWKMGLFMMLFTLVASGFVCPSFGQGCDAGNYISSGGECQPCIAGSFQPLPNQSSCIPCEEGLVSTSNSSTQCRPCGENEIPSMFHNRCDCTSGFIRSQESNECVPCRPGTYQYTSGFDRAFEACFNCSADEFQPNSGQTECLPCPEGMGADAGSDKCVPCDQFTCGNCPEFHSLGGVTCFRNAFPTPRPGPDGLLEQVFCAGGLGTQVDISKCTFVPCPDGTVVMSDGSCGTCSPGTSYNRTVYECQPCGPRQFMDVENVISGCFDCADDSFSLPGASECMKCPINQGLMADGSCATCEPGTFYNKEELRCELCPPNTFSRGGVTVQWVFDSTKKCISCPSSTFSFAGSDTCREDLCPRDNAPMKETGECGTCPPGKEYNRALATCERCVGMFSFEPQVKGNFGLFGCRPCFRGSVDVDLTMCNVSPRS